MGIISQPAGQARIDRAANVQAGTASVRLSGWRGALQQGGRILLSILKWIAISVLTLLSLVLVLVSLVWGPTHWVVAVLLALLWLAPIVLLVTGPARFVRWRAQLAAALCFIALGLLTVIVSQLSAYTPAIVDSRGKSVPGSIATLQTVDLNGSEQWISIRAKSVSSPVLLWLAGGPGGSQLATERFHLGRLEDHFVVVNWEQPGAGKSYSSVSHSNLTAERYIADSYALVQYLKARFNQQKVYLAGESWGSALGIWLVQRYPEQFYAFIGTGQMVDFVQTELYDYNFAMQLAEARGDTGKLDALKAQGPPPYYTGDVTWKQASYLLDGFNYMNQDPNIANDDGFDTFKDILSSEYGLYDKASWARGVFDSGTVMFPQLWKAGVDFRRDAPSLSVPVYFLLGRHDVNAPTALAEEYYGLLRAPRKELVWFERSGHNPWVTEASRFADVVVNRVLVENPPR
ncbi:MAG: alpha/beta hydrolase [Chloroflexota bacterium]